MIAGVCGGLAEYFVLDLTLVRVAYVIDLDHLGRRFRASSPTSS